MNSIDFFIILTVLLTNVEKKFILYRALRKLYGRGDGEKPSMRKVRAFQKQGAGEIPVEATLRKVQQKVPPCDFAR